MIKDEQAGGDRKFKKSSRKVWIFQKFTRKSWNFCREAGISDMKLRDSDNEVILMLVTDDGEMSWWQVWDGGDRSLILQNVINLTIKSHLQNDSAINTLNRSPS